MRCWVVLGPAQQFVIVVWDVFPRHPIVEDIKMLKGWILQD